MAIDYQADWHRRVRDEFGGDREKFYEQLVGDLASSYSFDEDVRSGTDDDRYLRGITAADIGEFFVNPRLAKSRSNFQAALRQGHKQGLKGAGRRLASQQLKLGLPTTGAVTRTEGSVGRPEGLAASSWFAKRGREHEDAMFNDPNMYSPITNVSGAIGAENAMHAARAKHGKNALLGGAAATWWLPGLAAALAAGAGGVQAGIDDQTRLATQLAAKFNPGLWSAKKRAYADAGSGAGLDYQPFGSTEGALGNLYRGSGGGSEEEDYLFGSYT